MNNAEHLPSHTRFEGILPRYLLESLTITVIGCGAIGAQVARICAGLSPSSLNLFDHDTVSLVNVGPQLFPRSAIGRPKVLALTDELRGIADPLCTIYPISSKFSPALLPQRPPAHQHIVFLCVDSMDTRRTIIDSLNPNFPNLLIDTRMGAENLSIHTVSPDVPFSLDLYNQNWYPSSEATPLPCTNRSTAYCAFVAAGLAVAALRRYLTKHPLVPVTNCNLIVPHLENP